jgi:hypothetical protein
LRKRWNLGEAFTQRDASARTFDDLFTLDKPRDPETWATITALPVPSWQLDEEALSQALSGLGNSMGQGIIEHARPRCRKSHLISCPANASSLAPRAGMSPEIQTRAS